MPTLQLDFLDTTDKIHTINFYIYESSLAKRWIELTRQNQNRGDKQIEARFTNTSYSQISKVRQRLTDCIMSINQTYDQPLPTYSEISELTTVELNYLHEEFERYGDRYHELMKKNDRLNQKLHDYFLKLNELIHLHEDVLTSRTQKFPPMAMLYDYYPQGIHSPILESDKIWLTSSFNWGDVYLGYNTLGKDWMKVCFDNDLEVIEREQVRPQHRFAAETWINFGPHDMTMWNTLHFERWVNSLPEHLRSKVPSNDLNKLTYGRFKIGNVIINDYFLKYNPDPAQWTTSDSQAKYDWNHTVFSTFVKLVDVKLYD